MSDLCLVLCHVRLTRTSLLDVLGFFWVRSGFLDFGWIFLGWIGLWVKNYDPYLVHELSWVKKYGSFR